MRKLASVQKIEWIRPIEGKDRIALFGVLGWTVICQKDIGNVGDPVVYCEIDSVLPEKPEFEFLRPKKFRIKTMKMAGCISQGICFPLSILPERDKPYEIGEDVTEIMGVTKYEPVEDEQWYKNLKAAPVPKTFWEKLPLMRFKWYRNLFKKQHASGGFPTEYISKTDETRIQTCPWLLEDKNTKWILSEKVDGCLVGNTLIKTNMGDLSISQIVNNRMQVSVLSYNEELRRCEFKPITDWHKIQDTRKHFKIGVGFKGHGNRSKFIECTDNHKFLTQNGWKRADELKMTDKLMHYSKIYPSELDEILVGCILGDSSLNSNDHNGTYRTVCFGQSDAQKEYFEYKAKLFGKLFCQQDDSISGYGTLMHRGVIVSNLQTLQWCNKYFANIGKKYVTYELADAITPISLAFWFMDDGTIKNRDDDNLQCRADICTNRYSLEEVQILAEALHRKFGIDVVIGNNDTYKGYILMFGVDATNKLASLIAPYVCQSMKYKLPKKYENMPCVLENFSLDYCTGVVETNILSIEEMPTKDFNKQRFVFDLEVADNHNYFAKNILVHNCSGSFLLIRHKHLLRRDTFEYIVCSRNMRLQHDDSIYWRVSDKYHIEDALKKMIGNLDWIAIQGECVGPKVQGNKYKLTEPDLYVFNLIYPDGRRPSDEAANVCEVFDLKFVPLLTANVTLPDTVDEMMAMAHGDSVIGPTIREGLVVRSMDGKQSFKAVDPEFLLKYKE